METSRELLTQSLALSALIAATLEYAVVVRHRLDRRLEAAEIAEAQQVGLGALVRVILIDDEQPRRPLLRHAFRRRAR